MQIIRTGRDGKPREVEFTETESAIHDEYNAALDAGYGVPQSAVLALRWAKLAGHRLGRLDPAFIDYLGEGYVVLVKGRPRLSEAAWRLDGSAS